MSRIVLPLVVASLLAITGTAMAKQYEAWGDTGWVYASKRECCDAAIAIAQDYSAAACHTSGGVPRPPMGGGQRGMCSSEWMQDEYGDMLYRCYASASLWCR